jgi:hypothetical protein
LHLRSCHSFVDIEEKIEKQTFAPRLTKEVRAEWKELQDELDRTCKTNGGNNIFIQNLVVITVSEVDTQEI